MAIDTLREIAQAGLLFTVTDSRSIARHPVVEGAVFAAVGLPGSDLIFHGAETLDAALKLALSAYQEAPSAPRKTLLKF